MKLQNSTRNPVTLRTQGDDKTIERETVPIEAGSRDLKIQGSTDPGNPRLEIVAEPGAGSLRGGADDDAPSVVLRDGDGEGSLRGGAGNDAPPIIIRDGDGNEGPHQPARGPLTLVRNESDRPLAIFVERSLPVGMAFRLHGDLETVQIIEQPSNRGLALVLRTD